VKTSRHTEAAVSQTHGTILMVVLTILLALLVLLLFRMPAFDWYTPLGPEPIIIITAIYHHNENNVLNYDSRVILRHNGTEPFENDEIRAVFFRNGEEVPCRIETLNGHRFIPTRHYGVQYMWGSGCQGNAWNPGEKIGIDFTDRTFMPGDLVQVDIIKRATDAVVSRHNFTA
jgi:hypothetical protein